MCRRRWFRDQSPHLYMLISVPALVIISIPPCSSRVPCRFVRGQHFPYLTFSQHATEQVLLLCRRLASSSAFCHKKNGEILHPPLSLSGRNNSRIGSEESPSTHLHSTSCVQNSLHCPVCVLVCLSVFHPHARFRPPDNYFVELLLARKSPPPKKK